MKLLAKESSRRGWPDENRLPLPDILLVGYGNPLRGTDRLGQAIVEAAVEHLGNRLRGVASHQLNPDMAVLLRDMRLAIFIDADTGPDCPVRVTPIRSDSEGTAMPHRSGPTMLLQRAENLYHVEPEAWLIAVPADDFEWCHRLSPIAQQAKARALEEISRIIRC